MKTSLTLLIIAVAATTAIAQVPDAEALKIGVKPTLDGKLND